MKIIANRIGMGLQAPDMAMARDVLRLVVTAVVAGTGFALLLALTVLSLTVISPPAAASGSPALTSSGSGFADGSTASAPGGQIAAADPSLIPAAAAASLPPAVTHAGVIDSPPQTGGTSSNLLWLVIALVAGVLAFSVASLARRK